MVKFASAVKEKINYIAAVDKDFTYVNIKNVTILVDKNNYINNFHPNNVQAQVDYE